jgi:hypothetical protein
LPRFGGWHRFSRGRTGRGFGAGGGRR